MRHMCLHAKRETYQCCTVTLADLKFFNSKCYEQKDKKDQDAFISKYVSSKATKRARGMRRRRRIETRYFVMKDNHRVVRVCLTFFLKALGIGKKRVSNIAHHAYRKGPVRNETRGGDRRSTLYREKKEATMAFIKSLKARDSHYCRKKSRKLYLPSDLTSIKKIWKMYNSHPAHRLTQVRYEFFRRIFRTKFRIGFGSPKSDACSHCERLQNQLKTVTDGPARQKILTELRVHKKRSNCFYELLREKREDMEILTFDHQQNQVYFLHKFYPKSVCKKHSSNTFMHQLFYKCLL